MKRMTLLLILGCLCASAHGQTACKPSIVFWNDATAYSHPLEGQPDIDTLLTSSTLIGCVTEGKKVYLVVTEFVEEKPYMFLAIPKSWLVKIVPLEAALDNPKPDGNVAAAPVAPAR